MPRQPRPDQTSRTDTAAADGVRRAAADMCLAARRLDEWMADPAYRPKYLTDQTRRDLADIRDRITTILGTGRHAP